MSAHRAVPPVGAVGLVLEPLEQVGLVALEVLLPDRRPVPAGPLRVGRQGVVRDHEVAVVADVVVLAQVAAAVVAVVRVAVVGEVHRDDARQVRRLVRRHLERGEAAVGDAHLVDVAVAERLGGQPLDRVVAVELLLQDVLVDVRRLRSRRCRECRRGRRCSRCGGSTRRSACPGTTSSLRYGMYSMTTGNGSPGSGSGT